jgi:hypothetical protein
MTCLSNLKLPVPLRAIRNLLDTFLECDVPLIVGFVAVTRTSQWMKPDTASRDPESPGAPEACTRASCDCDLHGCELNLQKFGL